jgi:nucleotidyltransferase/DNA polymerase involved in DNA repair
MVACLLIPGFELQAALRAKPRLALRPAALAPAQNASGRGGREPVVGQVTAAAEAAGVRPGMRLGEALATCPELVLVEQDPAGVEQAWEGIVGRLEDHGFAVEPAGPGCLYFDTKGVERLYGGVREALRRALEAVGAGWDAAARRFAALAAASVARAGQGLVVSDDRTRDFLAPLPLTLLPLDDDRRDELADLGVKRIGELAGLPGAAVAERLGPDGRRAWSLARGDDGSRVEARRPPTSLVERLEFPEPVANELTLRRALAAVVDRLLARPERGGRGIRKLAVSARLVGGGSWRRTLTLREATAEASVLRTALGPKLSELPAPILALRLEVVTLAEATGRQLELVRPEGDDLRLRLAEGLRQVRASAGAGAVATVVEVAPWSRLPEQRALLLPTEVRSLRGHDDFGRDT